MITSLSLGNFKGFKKLQNLTIRPLTVLSGTNSSGKSSILQSLLLLKQTLEGESRTDAIALEGKYLKYSNLNEISYGVPSKSTARISYKIDLGEGRNKVSLEFEIGNKTVRLTPKITRFSWTEKQGKMNSIHRDGNKYSWPKSARIRDRTLPAFYPQITKDSLFVEFDNFLPERVELIATNIEKQESKHKFILPIGFVNRSLANAASTLREELIQIEYLGPSRALPRRAYIHYSETNPDLDDDGGNAAQVLWIRKKDKVIFNGRRLRLSTAVSKCLEILGMHQFVSTDRARDIVYRLMLNISTDSKKRVTIADVGFGYSQVLPIILRGLLAPQNSLLLFEQPEIHLHPSAKARLADLFLQFMSDGKRLIVETHSTELINKLQLFAIKDNSLLDKVNIAFFEKNGSSNDQEIIVHQLRLNKNGIFDSWPDGFCDESEKIAREIIQARAKSGNKNE